MKAKVCELILNLIRTVDKTLKLNKYRLRFLFLLNSELSVIFLLVYHNYLSAQTVEFSVFNYLLSFSIKI